MCNFDGRLLLFMSDFDTRLPLFMCEFDTRLLLFWAKYFPVPPRKVLSIPGNLFWTKMHKIIFKI